jgi:hypothetical protein
MRNPFSKKTPPEKKNIIARGVSRIFSFARPFFAETKKTTEDQVLPLAPERMMQLGLNAYMKCGQVNTAFNMLADAAANGFEARAEDEASQTILDLFNQKVMMGDKVKMLVLNALIFGRAVVEVGDDLFKIRDPRSFTVDWDDEKGLIKEINQQGNHQFLDKNKIEIFILKRLFSDDLYGISAALPAFHTVEQLLEIKKGSKTLMTRFWKPFAIFKYPDTASNEEKADVYEMGQDDSYDSFYMIPMDWEVEFKGPGDVQMNVDKLIDTASDQIFVDLSFPKAAIMADSYKSDTEARIKLMIYEAVRPHQDKLKAFMEYLYLKHLGVKAEVSFDRVNQTDALTNVRILQEIADAVSRYTQMTQKIPMGPESQQITQEVVIRLIEEAGKISTEGIR